MRYLQMGYGQKIGNKNARLKSGTVLNKGKCNETVKWDIIEKTESYNLDSVCSIIYNNNCFLELLIGIGLLQMHGQRSFHL